MPLRHLAILPLLLTLTTCTTQPPALSTAALPHATTQPQLLDHDECFSSIQRTPAGKVRFVINPSVQLAGTTFTRKLYLVHAGKDAGYATSCDAQPGDFVGIQLMEMLGTGTTGLTLLEVHPDYILVRNDSWFYNISESHTLARVRYYNDTK